MTHAPQSSPALTRLPAWLALVCALSGGASPAPLAAQEQRPVAPAALLKEPGGARLARLVDTASLVVGRQRRGWTEVVLDGWVSSGLLERQRREGFDLGVRGDDVRLRATPKGAELARLAQGMLLERVGARGDWTRVRRTLWVNGSAVVVRRRTAAAPAQNRPAKSAAVPDTAVAYRPMDAGAPASAPIQAKPAATGSTAAVDADRIEIVRPAPMFAAPGGRQMGTLQPGTAGRVLSRADDWVRVQTEVWIRESDLKAAGGGALLGVTAAEVRANPARYVGQTVDWRVQYVATAVADELRPEMPPGQPYVLVRGPLPEPGFVYMMVQPEDLARIRAMPALSEMTVRVMIRAARTRFLATPVVELRTLLDPAIAAR